jgi:hypothetical protein
MQIASMGIDLGKNTFHMAALGERSKVLLRKKFSRGHLQANTASLPCSLSDIDVSSLISLRTSGHKQSLALPALAQRRERA